MKTRVLSIIYCLLFSVTAAFAQEEMFRVLANKGTNKVSTGNTNSWKAITPGSKILSNEKINIAEGGYLGLAHKNGKTLELKKAGVYDVAKLNSELASQNSGVAKKYVDFVAGEANAKKDDMSKDKLKYMDVTGSVERDVTSAKIKAITPKSKDMQVINLPFALKWSKVEKAEIYVVKVTNMFDETVYTAESKENNIVLDLSKMNLAPEVYKWIVSVKENPTIKSEEYTLTYTNNAELIKEASEMKTSLSEETALNKMVLATYFEDKKLLANALESYEAAMKLEPSVEDYRVAYGQFLERIGAVEAAK